MARTTSRAPSAGVRAGSAARNIAKRREKPYKTEQSRVLARKKKLTLRTTYTSAPPGFQFLPVGTVKLSERCKELSRQRDLPIHIVMGNPVSRNARDPEKVSHHIARVGWHFRSEVVDQACHELNYVFKEGRFFSEAELQAQAEQSKMAMTLAKHGMRLEQSSQRETDEQVRGAIKELFPRIPEDDLREILRFAWEEGSHRVGTNPLLELPRRVQLATIARIRHQYTDYDRLLRAFDWAEARRLVEPVCLAKLIEWRGENDQHDDGEFEEIVRETIVIDDDDEDSQDDDSDTSMEISHRPAVEADLIGDSHDESSKRFLKRYQPRPRDTQQRNLDVRQRIGAVREQLRNGALHAPRTRPSTPPRTGNVIQISMPENGDVVHIGGKAFRRATSSVAPKRQTLPPAASYAEHFQRISQPYQSAHPVDNRPLHERPVASIELSEDLRRTALATHSGERSNPVATDAQHPSYRRRSDYGPSSNGQGTYGQYRSPIVIDSPPVLHAGFKAVIDLTADDAPQRYSENLAAGGQRSQNAAQTFHGRSTAQPLSNGRQGEPAPIQYIPRVQQNTDARYTRAPTYPTHVMPQYPSAYGAAQQPKVIYVPGAQPSYQPQPIHGAPAIVQQVARNVDVAGQSSVASTQPSQQFPAHPFPTASHQQYYWYPR